MSDTTDAAVSTTSLSRFTIAVADVTLGDLMAAYGWVKIGCQIHPLLHIIQTNPLSYQPRHIIRLWPMMRFHRIILVFWSFGRGYEPRLDILPCKTTVASRTVCIPRNVSSVLNVFYSTSQRP